MIASAISSHVIVNTHTSSVLVAELSTSRRRVRFVGRCAYSHCAPRRHCWPRIVARHGIAGSGKNNTRSFAFAPPPFSSPAPRPNWFHIRSYSSANAATSAGSPFVTTMFSWFPSTACRVQLNDPLTSVVPSTMANLWCMWVLAASFLVGIPAASIAPTSLPFASAWSSSVITRTSTPRVCDAATMASAISLHVIVNTHTSSVLVAELSTSRRRVRFVGWCAYSHCAPRRHCWPRIVARHGIAGSGKNNTSADEDVTAGRRGRRGAGSIARAASRAFDRSVSGDGAGAPEPAFAAYDGGAGASVEGFCVERQGPISRERREDGEEGGRRGVTPAAIAELQFNNDAASTSASAVPPRRRSTSRSTQLCSSRRRFRSGTVLLP